MQKLFLIILATLNPQEKEALDIYLKEMSVLYANAGAVPVERFPITSVLIGEAKPDLITIIEFPDLESVSAVFTSEAYQQLLPVREKAFLSLSAFISENPR